MSSPKDQYSQSVRNSQEAAAKAVESLTKSAQSAFGTSPGGLPVKFDPSQVIDQVFDFAEQMLAAQRGFAKTLAATAASAAEAAAEQTAAAGEATSKATASAGQPGRKKATSASKSASKKATSGAAKPSKQSRARKS